MADWQKTQYAQPKSWRELQAENFEKKHPDAKKAPAILLIGILAIPVSFLCLGYMIYCVLRLFGLVH